MIIRKAQFEDIPIIMELIKATISDMEKQGVHQWDEVYPDEAVIRKDISEKSLYVFIEDNKIKGIIVLNENQDKEYQDLQWEYDSGNQLVIHRLCVHPIFQGQGVAKKLIQFAEEVAKEDNYEAIRLDSFVKNLWACKLYEKAGYKRVGTVNFRKGPFYCYEKDMKALR